MLASQVRIVVWKNAVKNGRDRRALFREFGVPLLLLAVMLLMRNTIPSGDVHEVSSYSTSILKTLKEVGSKDSVFLVAPCMTPNVSSLTSGVDRMAGYLANGAHHVSCFENEGSLKTWAKKNYKKVLGAVIVDNGVEGLDGGDETVRYRIRLDGDQQVSGAGAYPVHVRTYDSGPNAGALVWSDGPWASVQASVEQAMAAARSSATSINLPTIDALSIQQFPSRSYTDDTAADSLAGVIPIYMVMIFSIQMRVLLQAVLEDKEKGGRESMEVAGLSKMAYWLSWVVTGGAKGLFMALLVTIASWLGGLFGKTDPSILVITFLIFVLVTGPYVLLISSFFNTARTGGAVGMLVFVLTGLPGYLLVSPSTTVAARMGASFLAPSGLFLCAASLNSAEVLNPHGLQWSAVNDPNATAYGVPLLVLWGILLLDAILYSGIAWYVDKIVSDKHGSRLPPCFLCTTEWWAGGDRRVTEASDPTAIPSGMHDGFGHSEDSGMEMTGSDVGGRGGGGGGGGRGSSDVGSPFLGEDGAGGSGSGGGAAADPSIPSISLAPVMRREGSRLPEHPIVEPDHPHATNPILVRVRGLTKIFRAAKEPDAAAVAALARQARNREATATGDDHSAGVCGSVYDVLCRTRAAATAARHRGKAALDPLGTRARGDVVAVRKLDLDLYQDECVALLGHNGSGKSTTISALTSIFPADEGDAWIGEEQYSVTWNAENARKLIGYCPQQDVSLGDLTALEHTTVYAGIRGLVGEAATSASRDVLREVGLEAKTNDLVKDLSGGQKRRLAVACCLVGDPKVLFLDEPTSGCDAESRRKIWDVIERRKKGRVVVLVGHDMAEAQTLGDRIAILASGKLRVFGTSLFLKARFGIGYHLGVAGRADCRPREVLRVVQEHVPLAQLERSSARDGVDGGDGAVGEKKEKKEYETKSGGRGEGEEEDVGASSTEITITLPLDATPSFPNVLDALDRSKGELDITGFGVSVSTLEEVFLKLTEAIEEEEAEEDRILLSGGPSDADDQPSYPALPGSGRSSDDDDGEDGENPSSLLGYVAPELRELVTNTMQLKIMLWRRVAEAKRDWRGVALKCLLPLVFVAVSIAFRSISEIDSASTFHTTTFLPSLQFGSVSPNPTLPYTTPQSPSPVPYSFFLSTLSTDSGWPSGKHAPTPLPGDMETTVDEFSKNLLKNDRAAGAIYATTPTSSTLSPIILYNTSYTNGLPTLLSLFQSAMIRAAEFNTTTISTPSPLVFQATSDPWPRSVTQDAGAKIGQRMGSFIAFMITGLYVALGFAVIPALWAYAVVKERETRAKHLQLISGASPITYWGSLWVFDAILFVIPALGSVIILAAQNVYHFDQLAATFILIVAFGCALEGPVYALTFAFEKPETAQTWISFIHYFTMLISFFISFALELPSVLAPVPIRTAIRYVFSLFPGYALAKGLSDIALAPICNFADVIKGSSCHPTPVFSWDILGQKVVMLLAAIPLWLLLVLWLEARATPRSSSLAVLVPGDADEDEDVKAERTRVHALASNPDAILPPVLAVNVFKTFPRSTAGSEPLTAVRNMSLAVRKGEICGLLGANGAGKTTFLRILTGELAASSGTVRIAGRDLGQDRTAALRQLGYCPQRDVIFPKLTGREVLTFFARMNGIRAEAVDRLVTKAINTLGLVKHADQSTETYSGGNKRKLSTGVAYVGDPLVTLLDESSTGVDPAARRKLWEVIWNRSKGRATILTTHVLDEAATLCNRIAIAVNGSIVAIGPPSHLRARFSRGYNIELSLTSPEYFAPVLQSILAILGEEGEGEEKLQRVGVGYVSGGGGLKVLEIHGRHSRLELPTLTTSSLGAIFRTLNSKVDEHLIRDFSCSEATLEQAFLEIIRDQRTEEEEGM